MIELKTDYPTSETFLDGIRRCSAQINEALGDMQFLAKRLADGNYFMTTEEVADYLRCDINEIPKMPRYKPIASRPPMYRKKDVDDFIETRAVGKRKNIKFE